MNRISMAQQNLSIALTKIVQNDPSYIGRDIPNGEAHVMYQERNLAIMEAVYWAIKCGYKSGYTVHQNIEDMIPRERVGYTEKGAKTHVVEQPKWNPQFGVCAIIELPTGQVGWHLNSGDLRWDSHDTKTAFSRIKKFLTNNEVIDDSIDDPGKSIIGIVVPVRHACDLAGIVLLDASGITATPIPDGVWGAKRAIPSESELPEVCPNCVEPIEECVCKKKKRKEEESVMQEYRKRPGMHGPEKVCAVQYRRDDIPSLRKAISKYDDDLVSLMYDPKDDVHFLIIGERDHRHHRKVRVKSGDYLCVVNDSICSVWSELDFRHTFEPITSDNN